jgi:hypothetical protein
MLSRVGLRLDVLHSRDVDLSTGTSWLLRPAWPTDVVLEARHVGIIHQAIIAEAIRLVPIDAPEVGVEERSITGLQCANRRLWVTKHRYTRIQELCASSYP